MTSPWTALVDPAPPPTWQGERRVFLLLGNDMEKFIPKRKRQPAVKIKPWMLVKPGTREEAAMLASRGWWRLPA